MSHPFQARHQLYSRLNSRWFPAPFSLSGSTRHAQTDTPHNHVFSFMPSRCPGQRHGHSRTPTGRRFPSGQQTGCHNDLCCHFGCARIDSLAGDISGTGTNDQKFIREASHSAAVSTNQGPQTGYHTSTIEQVNPGAKTRSTCRLKE